MLTKNYLKRGLIAFIATIMLVVSLLLTGCNDNNQERTNYNNGDSTPPVVINYEGTSYSTAITLEDAAFHTVNVNSGAITYYVSSSKYSRLAIAFDGVTHITSYMLSGIKMYYGNSISDKVSIGVNIGSSGDRVYSDGIVNRTTGADMYFKFFVEIEWDMFNETNSNSHKIVKI